MTYGSGIYRIVRDACGWWCVAKITGHYDNGMPILHRVSNFYMYRGWAQNWARRMQISVQNYDSAY